ncbi:nudix-type nucleoside diphosphatase, YffH/AdpP family [Devosia lucknowensis]|uniref:GDP-mannose pyrophosphatase n=1 Tax=Devosia lucknowensis TaxID=1096929 RepID=A0A1Y6G9S2_9HYPH|nr:NUDIX domain-containing protein [Devosia lucknowensis]SMQ86133.1 nudix-type nucleoside diphosphatase, YffH/AdpP family [Devosia lucknowensis]
MSQRVTVVSTRLLSENWGRLTDSTIDYTRRDGTVQRFNREVYDHGNAAAVLLHDPVRDTVLLVRQFRYPALLNGDEPDLLEACAGLLDGEAPAVAAAREALEETGHAPRDIRFVCDMYASPGSVTEKVSLYIGTYDATTLRHAGGGLEAEGEEIELVELPLADALSLLGTPAMTDGKTIIMLQHLALERAGLLPGAR